MNRLTKEEIEAEVVRPEALRGRPVDLTDPGCPPSAPGRKWRRAASCPLRGETVELLTVEHKEIRS
ncbi:MAG: hypothetical protein LBT65_10240 [Synergistaceae bacterium]|jgi:hypothetical protein|nr:hypothetical protein [Synergistaceae bacterium]